MLHKRQTIVALIALVLTAVLMACGGHGEPPERSIDSALDNTEWVLTLLSGGDLVEGSNFALSFAESRVNGSAGWNSYVGEYTVADEGILTIPEIEITLQLCESAQGIVEQEDAYANGQIT